MKRAMAMAAMVVSSLILLPLEIAEADEPVLIVAEEEPEVWPPSIHSSGVWYDPYPLGELTEDEMELFARCVYAEAGNQGLYGQQLVASVILNRVDSENYPDTITEVITAPSQFICYTDGGMNRAEPTEETYLAIRAAMIDRTDNEIIAFRTGNFHGHGTPAFQYKDHFFSK